MAEKSVHSKQTDKKDIPAHEAMRPRHESAGSNVRKRRSNPALLIRQRGSAALCGIGQLKGMVFALSPAKYTQSDAPIDALQTLGDAVVLACFLSKYHNLQSVTQQIPPLIDNSRVRYGYAKISGG